MSRTNTISDDRKQLTSLKPAPLDPLPEQPLVSILISNYNYAAYLGEAIESSLRQTYNNLEVVVCDDGSTDASSRILERYQSQDRRIKVIYQDNGGQALALNAAFRKSAGQIICLLDADDVFTPHKLRRVVNAFAATPDSGFAVNRMVRVDKMRRALGEIPLLSHLPSGWQGPSLSLAAPQMLAGMPPCSGLSLRRPIAEAIFPLPPGLKAFADTLIQVLAPLITPIVAIQAPLSEYRVHGNNIAAVSAFTEDHLRNIVVWEREVWRGWRQCLASFSELTYELPSSPDATYSLMAYAYARFRSDLRSKAAYQAIPRDYFRSLPSLLRWYWRASPLMPNWLFRRSFAFVYGQTRAKRVVTGILSSSRSDFRAQAALREDAR
jgi:glycosyltransferase involved in cell wall biosynthesis